MAPEPTEHRMSPPESVSRSHTFSSLSLLSLRWRPARVPYRPEHAGRGFSSWSLPCGGSIVGLFRVTPPPYLTDLFIGPTVCADGPQSSWPPAIQTTRLPTRVACGTHAAPSPDALAVPRASSPRGAASKSQSPSSRPYFEPLGAAGGNRRLLPRPGGRGLCGG